MGNLLSEGRENRNAETLKLHEMHMMKSRDAEVLGKFYHGKGQQSEKKSRECYKRVC